MNTGKYLGAIIHCSFETESAYVRFKPHTDLQLAAFYLTYIVSDTDNTKQVVTPSITNKDGLALQIKHIKEIKELEIFYLSDDLSRKVLKSFRP